MIHPAELFFRAEWNDEKHLIHSASVIKSCLGMIEGTDLNKEVFIVSGWIHDMGKLIDKENHEIKSLDFLEKFLEQYPEYFQYRQVLRDCIINHRSKGHPKTISGEIFKLADKVALHNNFWKSYKSQN